MHVLQLTWTSPVVPFNGMSTFFEWHMIRKWTSWLLSTLWWVPSHKGKFDVRSFYKISACKNIVSFS
jgi:hypothetical protein